MTSVNLAQSIIDPDISSDQDVLDKQILGQLIAKTIREATSALLRGLQMIPLKDPTTQEILVEEFDE